MEGTEGVEVVGFGDVPGTAVVLAEFDGDELAVTGPTGVLMEGYGYGTSSVHVVDVEGDEVLFDVVTGETGIEGLLVGPNGNVLLDAVIG